MFHRTMTAIAFTAIFAAGLSMGAVQTAQAEDEEMKPCKAKKFEVPEVEKLCKAGGVSAVKKKMKEVVKKAKAAGEDMNCKSCHESTKELEKHKKGSVEELKKYL